MSTTRTAEDPEYYNHPYLESDVIEQRTYQIELADRSLDESSIVALPTGLGKTIVSLVAGVRRLNDVGGKIVFLAPTKPLVEQQAEFYRDVMTLPDHEIKLLTGDTKPEQREEEWAGATSVVLATPQVVQNDLIAGRISFEDVSHITFDECHRATGEYAYTYIAEKYWKEAKNPLVLGLSASPGTKKEDILSVAQNLGVTNIEVMTEDDPMVEPYTHETVVNPVFVSLDDELEQMLDLLYDVFTDNLAYCKKTGVINSRRKNIPFHELQKGMNAARKQKEWKALSVLSECIKLQKCIESLETQGVESFLSKVENYEADARDDDASKAVQRLVTRSEFKEAVELARNYDRLHPKMLELIVALKDALIDGGQALVFTENRANAFSLVEKLNSYGPVEAHRFVGQNNDDGKGMSQSDQQRVLQEFRDGTWNVLVATSVAEEGLDIPQVSQVVFYEPVSSGIRSIQRRGRTGRAAAGEVTVLIAKGTRDEGYWHASQNRESQMESDLSSLSSLTDDLNAELQSSQSTLSAYSDPKADAGDDDGEMPSLDEVSAGDAEDTETPEFDTESDAVQIIADTREGNSSVIRRLDLSDGIDVDMMQLSVGDYILSERVAVERKSAQDFADTLVEGRRSMFEQLGALVNNYARPVLILEGTQEELYNARNIHPNAIRGALQSLAVDYGVSVLWARDEEETAHHLSNIAIREQTERDRTVQVHGKKTGSSTAEEQEFIVSAIADVGVVTAQALLDGLGSVRAVFTADAETLQTVDGVGAVTADRIVDISTVEYEP